MNSMAFNSTVVNLNDIRSEQFLRDLQAGLLTKSMIFALMKKFGHKTYSVLSFLLSKADKNGDAFFTKQIIYENTGITYSVLKTAQSVFEESGIVKILLGVKGRATTYKIDYSALVKIICSQFQVDDGLEGTGYGSKTNCIRPENEPKRPKCGLKTDPSISYIYSNNITTTRELPDQSDQVQEKEVVGCCSIINQLKESEIIIPEPLKKLRLTAKQVVKNSSGELTLSEIQDCLDRLAFDLQYHPTKHSMKDPIACLLGCFRKGQLYRSVGEYKTPQEMEKIINRKFANWARGGFPEDTGNAILKWANESEPVKALNKLMDFFKEKYLPRLSLPELLSSEIV